MQNWIEDKRTENVLKSLGLSFKVQSIPIKNINLARGLKNQARDVALNPELVETYSASMKEGQSFPYVVLCAYKGDSFLMGGNHRVHAALDAGLTHLTAYVIETDDEAMWRALPKKLNAVEGQRASKSELIAGAKLMVDNYDWNETKAAKFFGVSAHAVNQAIRSQQTIQRLAKLGVTTAIPPTKLNILASIKNDHALQAAARLVDDTKLSSDELSTHIATIRNASSESDQLRVIDEIRKNLIGTGTNGDPSTKLPIPTFSKWRKIQTSFESFVAKKRTVKEFGGTSQERRDEIIRRSKQLLKTLQAIITRSKDI